MMLPRKEVACFVEMQQIAYNKTHKSQFISSLVMVDTDFASAHGMKQQMLSSSTQQAISRSEHRSWTRS